MSQPKCLRKDTVINKVLKEQEYKSRGTGICEHALAGVTRENLNKSKLFFFLPKHSQTPGSKPTAPWFEKHRPVQAALRGGFQCNLPSYRGRCIENSGGIKLRRGEKRPSVVFFPEGEGKEKASRSEGQ